MDFTARDRHEMLDAIEACRANSSDLNDPQLAQLATLLAGDPQLRVHFQRVQQSDVAIKAAMRDVPLPADLAARILRRLQEAASLPSPSGRGGVGEGTMLLSPAGRRAGGEGGVQADAVDNGAASPRSSSLPEGEGALTPSRRSSRRRILAGLATLSAAAAVLALAWLYSQQPLPLTHDDVLAKSMAFFSGDNDPPGKLVLEVAPPAEYPMSRDLRQSASIRWRRVAKFLGGDAVAYDLPRIGGKATLYVVRRAIAGLPPVPNRDNPDLNTAGKSVAAWESGGLLYVLVVEGDQSTYQGYFDRGPLT